MKEGVQIVVQYVSTGVECAASLIILYSSVTALFNYFKSILKKNDGIVPKVEVRLGLGRSLALALELLLGADILKTAIAPTWNEIGQLAAIAILRTGLNYFLEKELNKTELKD